MIGTQKAAYRRFRFTAVPRAWGGIAHVDRPAARFLRSYQLGGGYTPGPLLLLCVLAGLAGTVLALAWRLGAAVRRPALACLLFWVTGVVLLLAADITQFSWRYQLPGLVTLPPAAAAGATALLAWSRARRAARRQDGPAPVREG
jgi:hypothetical protein